MREALRSRLPYALLMLGVVALDQGTKALVDRWLTVHESRPVIEGLVSLTYVQNRGGAFGFLSDAEIPYQSVVFAAVSILALGAIAFYSFRLPARSRLPQTALALVMAGAVGNLLDRVLLGYVVDFVDVFWGRHHWPAFNVADSSISVGVALLIVDMLRATRGRESSKAEVVDATAPAARVD